jgi:hypothetical protein
MSSDSRPHVKTAWLALASVGLLAVTSAAQAKIITFGFSGELFGGPGLPSGPIAYTGQYSFEDVQPNTSGSVDEGDYVASSVKLDIGDTHYQSALGGITTFKDRRLLEDVYFVAAPIGTDGFFQFTITYDSLNVFPDVSLPLTPPPLTDTDSLFPSEIVLAGLLGYSGQLFGSLDNITCLSCSDPTPVPAPVMGTVMGVATASFLAFWVPRRRRTAS